MCVRDIDVSVHACMRICAYMSLYKHVCTCVYMCVCANVHDHASLLTSMWRPEQDAKNLPYFFDIRFLIDPEFDVLSELAGIRKLLGTPVLLTSRQMLQTYVAIPSSCVSTGD